MNFVYISPNFPENHWHFCDRLRKNGVTVLGIGDCPYDDLKRELKESLNEYYKVSSLENYDEVYRAVAWFIHKYGRIDYLESNNEYWLERDAALRQDFRIMSGFQPQDMPPVKCKSLMKDRYRLAGIPVALYYMVDDRADCLAFIQEVGYPVVAKPDNGVGANDTFRIDCEGELDDFFRRRPNNVQYIMEEYIDGDVVSYDAVVNSRGEPIFETGNITLGSIMDIVNEARSCPFMIRNPLPDALRDMGRAAVKAFGVKKRFIHFEFFHLSRDQRIGKQGDFAALEVNMRPSGGVSPTMMNFANSTDVYQIWADMIVFDESRKPLGERMFCAYAGRRDARAYVMSREDVLKAYPANIVEEGRVGLALAPDMGDYMFLARFPSMEDVLRFYDRILAEQS